MIKFLAGIAAAALVVAAWLMGEILRYGDQASMGYWVDFLIVALVVAGYLLGKVRILGEGA